MKADVVFHPSNRRLIKPVGTPLLKIIQEAGLPIGFSCRGQGICVACAIWIQGPCSPIEATESALLAKLSGDHFRDGFERRIACLVRLEGSVTVTTDYW